MREAAGATENRGLAAGTEKTVALGSRDWVTNYHNALLQYFMSPSATLDGSDPVEAIRQEYKGREKIADDSRGKVWLAQKVAEEDFVFENWVEEVRVLPRDEMIAEATRVNDKLTSTTSYANSVFSGIAGFFDRYPRIPFGRPTTFTRDNPDKRFNQVLIAKNKDGYDNLSNLSSLAFTEGLYGQYPRIDKELIRKYKKNVIALSGNMFGIIPKLILNQGIEAAEEELKWWLDTFGEDFYLELNRHDIDEENHVNEVLLEFSKLSNCG